MFESFQDALNMIGVYTAVGFALAVLYNILRFFRLAFPKMKKSIAAADVLFTLIAGFVLFAFSVDRGMGFFRLYYVAAAAFGFALNMVTLGLPVPVLARVFGKVLRRVWDAVSDMIRIPTEYACKKAIYISAESRKIISKIAEKYQMHLQKRRNVMYNSTNRKIAYVYPKGGENRNAIKAKVRKIV